jgi:hypothetical protein
MAGRTAPQVNQRGRPCDGADRPAHGHPANPDSPAGLPRVVAGLSSPIQNVTFTAIFSEPNDIVAHPQLSREMKLALLRQWEQTARSLSVAESEGMGGGEENKLGRVELAIALVEKQP